MAEIEKSATTAGVIGAGSFGTAIANILAENPENGEVLLYTRRDDVVQSIIRTREHNGQKIHPNIRPITDMQELTGRCNLLFPIVPSANFRDMIRSFSPF